jgi:hypothetical protein
MEKPDGKDFTYDEENPPWFVIGYYLQPTSCMTSILKPWPQYFKND